MFAALNGLLVCPVSVASCIAYVTVVPAACCPLLNANVWLIFVPGFPATPVCMFTLSTLPSPHVHLYFCPLPNSAVVPGAVVVLFVN